MNERYTWRGGSEMLLRHGAGARTTLLMLPALFEEANRMRRFTVSVMRALATRGIGTMLPDLPGTGESLTALADVSLADWHDAVRALADGIRGEQGKCLTVAVRGGALLDSVADRGWQLAPERGERVLRDLVRATALSAGTSASAIDRQARIAPLPLAGHTLSPSFYADLFDAQVQTMDRRTAHLVGDAGQGDVALAGTRLWRQAEPGDDAEFVTAAVSDIADWTATCVNL